MNSFDAIVKKWKDHPTQYEIVMSESVQAVTNEINAMAEAGWFPLGGISTHYSPAVGTMFAQAMVRRCLT